MKIGVITYWQSNDNYGQLLQCFALQSYLINCGHDVYLIRYDFMGRNRRMVFIRELKNFLYKMLFPEYRKRCRLRYELDKHNIVRNFDRFRKEKIKMTTILYPSLSSLQENPPKADLYIAGSDQIWSQLLDKAENEVFYLNFGDTNIKRISYAASFGMDRYPEELIDKLSYNLNRFDGISIREENGVQICKKAGHDVVKVVDPTMLPDISTYVKLESAPQFDDYIYIYSLNISNENDIEFGEISSIAGSKNMDIIVTPASGCIPGYELFSGVKYNYATIPEWLSNIHYANTVITTSFHGVVFSILYNTPFVYVPLKGNLSKMNIRALDLLESLGLSERIKTDSVRYEDIINRQINWDVVNRDITRLKKESIDFLNAFL